MDTSYDNTNFIDLVRKAQLGCQESMDNLAQLMQHRLFAYIYRLTLNYDVAEDLQQETLLEMVKSLKKLRRPDRFQAWLYRTALGKVQHYFRGLKSEKAKQSMPALNNENLLKRISGSYGDGLKNLINKELSAAIVKAMGDLKLRHRNILVLRCCEQLPYSRIANIMNCSETAAQVLFFRAKQQLKRKLSRSGFGKGILLAGLGLFSEMTAPADAAPVTVSAASVKVGTVATVIGAAGTKLGITIGTMVTATALTVGTITSLNDTNGFVGGILPKRFEVKSFHYVEQAWGATGRINPNLDRGRSLSKGAYEQWFYFPEDIDGPMFMMMQRWDPQQRNKLCGWLQNDSGNYYYHAGEKRIYILNYHLPLLELRTRRLPSDTPEFTEFLDQCEGKIEGINYTRDPETGLLMGALDNRFYDVQNYRTSIRYNTLSDKSFDDFRYIWPEDTPKVDERDVMHKRGWTYFQISGEINGKPVQGWGRIPFVYVTWQEHPPWLKLNIGNELKIIDSSHGAYLTTQDEEVIAAYPAGSFFKGLARPWMGMHTIDIIRRDAAEKRVRFSTQKFDFNENTSCYEKAVVTLFVQPDRGQGQIKYTINLDKDLTKRMKFLSGDNKQSVLNFTYLEDVEFLTEEFDEPADIRVPKAKRRDGMGILWIIELAQGTLGQ